MITSSHFMFNTLPLSPFSPFFPLCYPLQPLTLFNTSCFPLLESPIPPPSFSSFSLCSSLCSLTLTPAVTWPSVPDEMSEEAKDLIDRLLALDPNRRLTIKEIKSHDFFCGVDWDNILSHPAPFIPNPSDKTDTSYFDARNQAQNLKMSIHQISSDTGKTRAATSAT
eukprot:Colp12_sorted_trinity150504_noHs@1607